MEKLDPIIPEFATEQEAESYDVWFREQVEEGMRSKGPWIPHDEVMREARDIIESASALGS